MGKRKGTSDEPTSNTEPTPGDGKHVKSDIPQQLPWSENDSAKTYKFITKMEKLDNFKVFFGKKDKTDVSILLLHCNLLLIVF
jgi:hypothetical protein